MHGFQVLLLNNGIVTVSYFVILFVVALLFLSLLYMYLSFGVAVCYFEKWFIFNTFVVITVCEILTQLTVKLC